ncbi:hypothetical protein BST61_g9736 [Cercospora zeina]
MGAVPRWSGLIAVSSSPPRPTLLGRMSCSRLRVSFVLSLRLGHQALHYTVCCCTSLRRRLARLPSGRAEDGLGDGDARDGDGGSRTATTSPLRRRAPTTWRPRCRETLFQPCELFSASCLRQARVHRLPLGYARHSASQDSVHWCGSEQAESNMTCFYYLLDSHRRQARLHHVEHLVRPLETAPPNATQARVELIDKWVSLQTWPTNRRRNHHLAETFGRPPRTSRIVAIEWPACYAITTGPATSCPPPFLAAMWRTWYPRESRI